MITTDAKISLEKMISKTLGLFRIDVEKRVNWFPGMFLQLSLSRKSASEPWLDSKPFSIASWGGQTIRIIVRKEGSFTTELFSIGKEGSLGTIKYPLGSFYLNETENKVFLAGGAGISAFSGYLDYVYLKGVNNRSFLYYSTRSSAESLLSFYWGKIPDNISVNENFTRDLVNGKMGKRLTIEDLRDDISEMNSYKYYVCGPPGFTKYWVDSLTNEKLKVRTESWLIS